ncbi:MmgE/PrpD family protein [Castellaniella sp.]|uniref:MmgE/PrpD family protein n=1 Tax=Castellaniella sp. TaxID=1955812 RepID=UPI00355FE1EF
MAEEGTVLAGLAAYAARLSEAELEAGVTHAAKRVFLDWLAALYPGTQMAPATLLRQAWCEEVGLGRSRVPGTRDTVFPATAAWLNGSASHAAELDDIFKDGLYHPGCPVIAAALAVGDDIRASGSTFLRGVIAGYEVSTRIAAAIQPAHYRYFHTTGTVGCIGAAAAAAAILTPGDAFVAQHAMATAASFASGLQQAFRSDAMTKALHAGHAAAVGVRAAQAAKQGVTGVADIMEGPVGFGAALAEGPDWFCLLQGAGAHFNITRMTQKTHACCGHTFAAIDAVLHLRASHRIQASEVDRIEVHTYGTALEVAGNPNPLSAFEGKFSLPYVMCHALVEGAVDPASFAPDKLSDPQVRQLMARVSLHEDAGLSARFPRQRAARVRMTLHDGTTLEHFSPHRKGDPEEPLSDADLDQKFLRLASTVLGVEAAQNLRDRVWLLDTLDLADLIL